MNKLSTLLQVVDITMKWTFQNDNRYRSALLLGFSVSFTMMTLQACNNTQTKQPETADSAVIKWQVSLTITGGLQGQNRTISINQLGVAQFTDHINKTMKNSPVSPSNLNKLLELIKYHSTETTAGKAKSNSCRDCFSYTINVSYDGNISRRQVNDLNMDENTQQLIGALKLISSTDVQQTF